MGASSLLGVETAGLLLAALFVGWGGADVVRALAAGARASRIETGRPRLPRAELAAFGLLFAGGLLGGGVVALAFEGPGTGWAVGGMFFTGFGTLVALEYGDRVLDAAGAAERASAATTSSPPGTAVPRYSGILSLAIALPLLEVLAGFVLSGGNSAAIGGLALGAAAGALGIRWTTSRREPGADHAEGGFSPEHPGSDSYLWFTSAVVGSVLIAAASQDVRELFAGVLLLPVIWGAAAGLGARVGYAVWGNDEGRPARGTLGLRAVAVVVPAAFFLYLADWALQVGRPWALASGVLGVVACSVIAILPRLRGRSPGPSPGGDPPTDIPAHLPRRFEGAVLLSLVLAGAVGWVVYRVGGSQAEWGGVFVPDLGIFCLGLFGVAFLAILPEVGIARAFADRAGSTDPRTPPIGARLSLVAFVPALAAAGAAYAVSAPVDNGVAAATFWTWLTVSNSAVVLGGACGVAAAVASLLPVRRLTVRSGLGGDLGQFGTGALVTAVAGAVLGPAGWFGGILAFGGVGALAVALRRPASSASPARSLDWGTVFPFDLTLGAWTGVVFAAVFFHHGGMVSG